MVKASPALSENRHLYPSLHSFLLVADSLWDPFQYSASISHSQLTIPTMSNMAATRHVWRLKFKLIKIKQGKKFIFSSVAAYG